MEEVTIIGINLAKCSFQVHGARADGSVAYCVYRYGKHLAPGLTEVRSYAAFSTSLPAGGLRARFRGIPASRTA